MARRHIPTARLLDVGIRRTLEQELDEQLALRHKALSIHCAAVRTEAPGVTNRRHPIPGK